MKVTSEFECVCKYKTKVIFQKPSFVKPSIIGVKCGGCNSKYSVKYFRKPGNFSHRMDIEVTPIEVSEILKTRMTAQRYLAGDKS